MTRDLRRAVVAHLKADAALTTLVPVSQIHPSTIGANPTFPLIFWEAPNAIPVGRGCTAGEDVSFFIQIYAQDRQKDGAAIETAESFCERITAMVKARLHQSALTLAGGALAKLRVRSIRTVRDGSEVAQWHATLTVRARCYTG